LAEIAEPQRPSSPFCLQNPHVSFGINAAYRNLLKIRFHRRDYRMLRNVMLTVAAVCLAVLGLVGLVLPLMPGLLFLAGAALCLSAVSPRLRTALTGVRRHPRLRRLEWRWRAGRHLPLGRRVALGFWLALSALLPLTNR